MNENDTVVNDPLNMLGTTPQVEQTSSGDGGSEPSTSSYSSNTEPNNRRIRDNAPAKDDIRVESAMSHDRRNLITNKDLRNLKRNKYEAVRDVSSQAYIIRNKKTGQIVEIRALSAFHACNLIGWRPKNCKVVDVIKAEEAPSVDVNNTSMESANETEKAKVENTPVAPVGVPTATEQV